MSPVNSVLGLDIGRHSVKAVRAVRRGGRLHVTHAEMLRIPPDVGDKAEVIQPWLASLNLRATPCIVGIPGDVVMFQPMVIAPDDPRTPAQAVGIEIARYNEMASESMVYDFSPLSAAGEEKRLTLAMARPSTLEQAMAIPRNVGLQVVDLIPTPVAAYNALRESMPEAQTPVAFLNIGHAATEVVVGTLQGIMFARSFAMGGASFTDAVAKRTGHAARHAEDLKVAEGSLAGGGKEIQQALIEAADAWFTELEACLSVYYSSYPDEGQKPGCMMLCGGGAELTGLPQYIRARLDIQTVEARTLSENPIIKAPGRFTVAKGLAMGGIRADGARISLLPPTIRDSIVMRRQKKHWMASGICAALVLGISVYGGYRDIRREQRQLSKQRADLSRCRDLAERIQITEGANKQLISMAVPVESLVRNGPFMRDLISLLSRAKDTNDWVTVICDVDSYYPKKDLLDAVRRTEKEAAATPMPYTRRATAETREKTAGFQSPFRSVIVEGYTMTPDLSTVQALISNLKASPFVESADLLSDDRVIMDAQLESRWSNTLAKRFVIEIVQSPPERDQPSSALISDAAHGSASVSAGRKSKTRASERFDPKVPLVKIVRVDASSTHTNEPGEGPPSALIDRNLRTRWSSDFSEPQQIVLKLEKETTLARLRIHWEIASAARYAVHLSSDGKEWTRVFPETGGEFGPKVDEVGLKHTSASFVKIELVNRVNDTWGFSIYEIEVIASQESELKKAAPQQAPTVEPESEPAPAGGSG